MNQIHDWQQATTRLRRLDSHGAKGQKNQRKSSNLSNINRWLDD